MLRPNVLSRSFIALVTLAALPLTGCGAKNSDETELKFAYFKPSAAMGGPLGRLQAINLGMKNDFDQLRVCVEIGLEHISDAQILLEAKLAYATWLNAAGGFTEADWQRFVFEPKAKCSMSDSAYTGNIILERLANMNDGDQNILTSYQEEKISCTFDGQWKKCGGSGVTLGWGGPGSLSTWYIGNPSHWTKLAAAAPSTTTLSPYLDWFSLDEELNRNTAKTITPEQKATLKATYQTLTQNAEPSMAALSGFVSDMAKYQLTTADDPIFGKLVKGFYSSHDQSLDKTYRGERSAFSVLLHEVGHQFGMDHADNPSKDSLTGASGGATQNADGQWITKLASMAYGLPYLYLTDDDVQGVQANRQSIADYLKSHL